MKNLTSYIIRASFSQERMQYLDQEGKFVYPAKDKKTSRAFPALEWMAAMYSHILNKGEQMVRYFNSYTPTVKREVLVNNLPLRQHFI